MNHLPTTENFSDLWEKCDAPVESSWTIDLASSPTDIWPLLADTSGLNERLGLPEMVFEEREGHLHGSSGRGFLRQDWVEVPWAWEVARRLTAERRYTRGPARAVRVRYQLEEFHGGTRLSVFISWIPRVWWSRPVLGSINRWLGKQYKRVLSDLDDLAGKPRVEALQVAPTTGVAVDENCLQVAIQKLDESGVSKAESDRLATHIRTASDQQLFRIRQ